MCCRQGMRRLVLLCYCCHHRHLQRKVDGGLSSIATSGPSGYGMGMGGGIKPGGGGGNQDFTSVQAMVSQPSTGGRR